MTLIQQLNANYQSTCSAPSPFFFLSIKTSILSDTKRTKHNEEQRRQKEEMRLQSEHVQAVISVTEKHYRLFFDPLCLFVENISPVLCVI